MPFELAVREGGALGVMTRTTGSTAAGAPSSPTCCVDILRDEWGFEGFVVTDWFGVTGTAASAEAGLDLEMPGPGRAFGPAAGRRPSAAGEVDEADWSTPRSRRLLAVFERVGRPRRRRSRGDETRSTSRRRTGPSPRRAAAEAMVLLANDGVAAARPRRRCARVAVIGPERRPRRDHGRRFGPGDAAPPGQPARRAHRGARRRRGRACTSPGCDNRRSTPLLGETGTVPRRAAGARRRLVRRARPGGRARATAAPPRRAGIFGLEPRCRARRRGLVVPRVTRTFVPEEDGHLRVAPRPGGQGPGARRRRASCSTASPTRRPPAAPTYFGIGSQRGRGRRSSSGPASRSRWWSSSRPADTSRRRCGSGLRPPDADAACSSGPRPRPPAADVAVVVVGTTGEWESEGDDRPSMDLPGRPGRAVRRVAGGQPRHGRGRQRRRPR